MFLIKIFYTLPHLQFQLTNTQKNNPGDIGTPRLFLLQSHRSTEVGSTIEYHFEFDFVK